MKRKNNIKLHKQESASESHLNSTSPGRINAWIGAILVSFITFAVYLPALKNGFVNWDDPRYIYENPHIQLIDLKFLKWVFTSIYFNNWHPLTMVSYALDYAVWGLKPFGYHLTNVIFHTANTFLVFILAIRLIECGLTQNPKLVTRNFSLITASITALLFGIHPIHVESVAWISERKDVLYAFFYLLGILAYLKYATADSKRPLYYGLTLILFVLSLMSKPMAVTFPIVLLILDFYPLKRLKIKNGMKPALLEKSPFFIMSLLSSLIAISAQRSNEALQTLETYSIIARVIVPVRACVFYLVKMVLPLDLAPFYLLPDMDTLVLEFIGSFVVILTITFLGIRSWKKDKLFSAICIYYIVTLIPVIGVVQVGNQAAADRYTYLPSLGPFLLAGLGAARVFGRFSSKQSRIAIASALLLPLGILAGMTVKQTGVWRDSITLWSHEISIYPNTLTADPQRSPIYAYNNRGIAYYDLGKYEQAIADYTAAIKLNSQYAEAYNNRGIAYQNLGNYEQAIKDYSVAIELNPRYAEAYNNRGYAYGGIVNNQLALNDFNKAIELNSQYAVAYKNRGIAYGRLGNKEKEIEDFNKAIELNPRFADAYNHRGIAYYNMNNSGDAISDFDKAIELNPKYVEAYNNRGIAYYSLGDARRAINDFNKAIELNPSYSKAYQNLEEIYSGLGDIEKANFYRDKAAGSM